MINKLMNAMINNKHAIVIAIAVMVVFAYAVPYGMDAEAQNPNNKGKHYGLIQGDGYGLSCDHFKPGKGPARCT